MEAVILKADGTSERRPLEKKLKLEEYQAIVGGYVEVVKVRHEGKVCDMVVNENGVGEGLPDNRQASNLLENFWLERYGLPGQRSPQGMVGYVVGDVVILHGCRL